MLLKAGVVSLVLLLASRVLGLLRESAQAAAFGASGLADAVVLMLALPDWITGLVAAGALSYVLLPLWAQQSAAAQAESERRVARALLAIGAVLALLLAGGRLGVLAALAPGLSGPARDAAARGLIYAAMALPLALLAALWSTRAQHRRDFVGLYAANLVVNGVLVTALFFIAMKPDSEPAIDRLGLVLLLAMAARLWWLAARRRGWVDGAAAPEAAAAPAPAGARPRSTPLPGTAVWLWAALAAGLPLALPFAARSMASAAGEGALTTFNYAWKLVELPLVLAVQLAASLSFPGIAAAYAAALGSPAERAAAESRVRAAMALAWTLACMAAAGLIVGADALAMLLFGWGRMPAEALVPLAQWARVGAWSLLPQALIAVALTALASQARLRVAALVWALGLATLLASNLALPASGRAQMAALDAVLALVAVGLLALLGPGLGALRRLLPLRLMLATGAVLLACSVGVAAWGVDGAAADGAGWAARLWALRGPLGGAVGAAALVGAVAALSGLPGRRWLRRQ